MVSRKKQVLLTVRLDEDLADELEKHAQEIESERGVRVSRSEISRALMVIGLRAARAAREAIEKGAIAI